MSSFEKLGLKKNILEVLEGLKFTDAQEVQEKVIPPALKGKNIVCIAQTGSGKTLAYSIPYLNRINTKLGIQVLVLVPTRELCIQVTKEITKLAEPLGLKIGMLYGGRDLAGDHKTVNKKMHILIGTPGRLIQHINEKNIKVGDVQYLVYDESDQMFDNGFFEDCMYVRARVSKKVQIVLASATITEKVETFMETVEDPQIIKVEGEIPKTIVQEKLFCPIAEKNGVLLDFFEAKKPKATLIFCNTKLRSEKIADHLIERGFRAKYLNSDFEQKEREDILNLFRDKKIRILVTTDIAARGLHIPHVDCIINYDVPTRDEFYVHRVGRTGRGKKKGYALTLVCPEDDGRFANLEFEYQIEVPEVDEEFKRVQ